jgi:hypothetical protein
MAKDIFARQAVLKPSAMKTVAERRFDDAEALRKTNDNARANGVAYLAGFVIEILLKAKLVEKYPRIARKRQHALHDDEREVWLLIWKRHDLEDMLSQMPELEAGLKKKGELGNYDYHGQLKTICATWTIQARYSSLSMPMREATELLGRVRKLKELLK